MFKMELQLPTGLYNILPPLQHYTELPDIKHVIVNNHAIEPQVLRTPMLISFCTVENYKIYF